MIIYVYIIFLTTCDRFMNTITSPHMTTPAQDTPSFHAKGNAYLASIKQQTTKLQTEKVIDYVQDNN